MMPILNYNHVSRSPIRTYATTNAINSDTKFFTQFSQTPVDIPQTHYDPIFKSTNFYSSFADTRPEINYNNYLYNESLPTKQKTEPKYLDDNDLIEKTAQLINRQHRIKMLNQQAQQNMKNNLQQNLQQNNQQIQQQNNRQIYQQNNQQIHHQNGLHIQNNHIQPSVINQALPPQYFEKLKLLQLQVQQLQIELKKKQLEQEYLQKQIQSHLVQNNFYSSNPYLEQSKQNLRNQQEQLRLNLEQKINQFNLHQQEAQTLPQTHRSYSYDKNRSFTSYEKTLENKNSNQIKYRSSSHAPESKKEIDFGKDKRTSRAEQFYQTQEQEISIEYNKVLENLLRKNESNKKLNSVSSTNLNDVDNKIYDRGFNLTYAAQPSERITEPRKIFLNNAQNQEQTGLYPSKTEASLDLRSNDDRNLIFERHLREVQMRRRLEQQKLKEKEEYEKKLIEARQIEERLKWEHEMKEREFLEKKLRDKERIEIELREQQMKEKLRREQEQREKELLEQKLREKEMIEKQLLEQQMKEKFRLEQEAREREVLEKKLRDQEIRAQQLREQQKREQEILEKQLREKEIIEKQLREQQIKEIEEKEALAKKLKEKELFEQKKKEQQKLKEKLKREKKIREQKLKTVQDNKIHINIEDFKRLEFSEEEVENGIFFDMHVNKEDSEVPTLNENEIEIKDFADRLPKTYSGEFNSRRKFANFYGDEYAQFEESVDTDEENFDNMVQDIKSAASNLMSQKLSSLISNNVEVILEEEEEEAEREYKEMMEYSK